MEESQRAAIFAVRSTVGQEKSTADIIAAKSKNFDLPIKAVLAPPKIRGYVFVEAIGKASVEKARAGVKHVKGVVSGEIPMSEVEHFLEVKPAVEGLEIGDTVELISGPFRGERARIVRIDESKEEITVELFEAMVPIPVTTRADHVKTIRKGERE
jgi:transcriptional antiterminator NusG